MEHRFADRAFLQFTPLSDILPFGAGKHHCTGSLLALMEMELVEPARWTGSAGRSGWTDRLP